MYYSRERERTREQTVDTMDGRYVIDMQNGINSSTCIIAKKGDEAGNKQLTQSIEGSYVVNIQNSTNFSTCIIAEKRNEPGNATSTNQQSTQSMEGM